MAADTVTEAVLGGVVNMPLNRFRKVTFEYSNGTTLVLEGDVLNAYAGETRTMYQIFMGLMNAPTPPPRPQQNQSAPPAPPHLRPHVTSDSLVDALTKHDKSIFGGDDDEKGTDNDEEE